MNFHISCNFKNSFVLIVICSFIYLVYLIWRAGDRLPGIDVEIRDVLSYIVLAVEMGAWSVSKIYEEGNRTIEGNRKSMMSDVGKAELLTRADLVSNHLMLSLLKRFPLLRVISEEKESLSEKEVDDYRLDNYQLWLRLRSLFSSKFPQRRVNTDRLTIWVDPLDATQEFTEGLTEYVSVMACVAIDGQPYFGAIRHPFTNETVLGLVDHGVFDLTGRDIFSRNDNGAVHSEGNDDGRQKGNESLVVVVSRSHAGSTVEDLIHRAFSTTALSSNSSIDGQQVGNVNSGRVGHVRIEPAGGAGYKALRIVRGTADLYVHTTAIKLWDLCAGDAIVKAAGGSVLSLGDGRPLDYTGSSNPLPNTRSKNGSSSSPDEKTQQPPQVLHKAGLLMAVRSPYSALDRLRKSTSDAHANSSK